MERRSGGVLSIWLIGLAKNGGGSVDEIDHGFLWNADHLGPEAESAGKPAINDHLQHRAAGDPEPSCDLLGAEILPKLAHRLTARIKKRRAPKIMARAKTIERRRETRCSRSRSAAKTGGRGNSGLLAMRSIAARGMIIVIPPLIPRRHLRPPEPGE